MHSKIDEMMEKIAKKKIEIWRITNGTLLFMEKCRSIIIDNVSDIGIGLDSVNPGQRY